jgi:sec-independent protein translocase protein TatA
VSSLAQIAFIFPSGSEMVVLLLVGIMLFGRRLPEVGRKVGRTVVQLRQGFHKLQREIDLDNEMRDVTRTVRDTRDELTRSTAIPREFGEPDKMLRDLTDATLSSVVPDGVLEDVPHSLFESNGDMTEEVATTTEAEPPGPDPVDPQPQA